MARYGTADLNARFARRLLTVGAGLILLLGLVATQMPVSVQAAPSNTIITYARCPTYSRFQADVSQIGSGESGTVIFAPGLDCTYGPSNGAESGLGVQSGASVTIFGNGLTLSGGPASDPGGFSIIVGGDGSAIAVDRATLEYGYNGISDPNGTVTLTNGVARGNRGNVICNGRACGHNPGFGVYAKQVTVSHSTVSGNYGIGIRAADLTVQHSVVSDNVSVQEPDGLGTTSPFGGYGVRCFDTCSVMDSIISDNFEGIYGWTITVAGSTIADNIDAGIVGSTAVVTNSTITGNDKGIEASFITATSSTVSGNLAAIYDPFVDYVPTAFVKLTADVLVDAGSYPICTLTGDLGRAVPLIDGGYNRSADGSCPFTTSTSKVVSAGSLDLQPLADNGGQLAGAPGSQQIVPTIALGSGSTAIDIIPVTNGQCSVGEQTDQRGVHRPQGTACDSGAFEATDVASVISGTSTVVRRGYWAIIRVIASSTSGQNVSSRTLRVSSVELDGPGGQVIDFVHPFQFGRFGGIPGYQLVINTRDLTPGQWTLKVSIAGTEPATSSVKLTVE